MAYDKQNWHINGTGGRQPMLEYHSDEDTLAMMTANDYFKSAKGQLRHYAGGKDNEYPVVMLVTSVEDSNADGTIDANPHAFGFYRFYEHSNGGVRVRPLKLKAS